MDDQDLFRGKKQIWKIDGNWYLDKQFIRVCKCEATGTVLDPYLCTRCTDTFTSYLDYLSHTCTPRRLYQCCSCRHLYVTEEEFDSHDCRPCRYPSDCIDDYAYSDTSIGGEIDLPLETMKHTDSPGIFSASTEENSDGLLQKIKKEEIESDADSLQTEEMEEDADNSNMTDLHDNEMGLHATGQESASNSQDHHETSVSNSDIATESQEQALQESGVLQGKNKTRHKSSSATREKRVTETNGRKRKWGREQRVIKGEVEGLSEVILNQISGMEGRAVVTKKSIVSKVVESEIQRMISTKWKNGGEETEAGDPMTGSEGEMDHSVRGKTEKDITLLSRNNTFTTCSEEVSNSQSGPHNKAPEVPVNESGEKEDSRGEKEMHGWSKSNRNTAAGSGHAEAKLVFQKLGISNIPNPGKEFKVFKLMTSDPFKDAKSTSIISPVQHPKAVPSTPTKGVKNNRSLIKLLSTPPTDYTSQHALQTSLLPCNNVFSPLPNSYVGNSSQTGQNTASVMRGFASATGLSTATNDSILSTSQQEENTDSKFSEESPDISIVKSELMDKTDNDSEHVDEVPQTTDPDMEPTITTIKREPMDDYSYNIPPTQVTDSDHAVEGQKPFIKSEPMDSVFDIPQTQDNDIENTTESQNPIIKSEPLDDSYNFIAGYSVSQNDTPEAIEESIRFTNLKKEPVNDLCNFSQNQYDTPHSRVTAEGYENFTTVKTEQGEESSTLSSCYSVTQNVLHSQVSEEKQNLAIVNAVNAALENSGIPSEILYGEEREQTLPTEKRTGSDTGQFWLYNCKTCGKKFKHAGTLMVHERAHNLEKKQYQCFICGRICTAASYLKVHLRTHKEEPSDNTKRKIQCFKCDEQFLHEQNFQTHMRMHFQKGLTYCIKCGKRFYRKNQLDKHMENHTDKYPCKHCGREFSSQAGRTIHLNSHNKEKQTSKHPTDKFPCEQCGKQFSSAASRALHLTIHNRDKETINCPICDRVFEKNLVKYESHLREHELATLFLCPICGHGFSTKGELTQLFQIHQRNYLMRSIKFYFNLFGRTRWKK